VNLSASFSEFTCAAGKQMMTTPTLRPGKVRFAWRNPAIPFLCIPCPHSVELEEVLAPDSPKSGQDQDEWPMAMCPESAARDFISPE